MTRYSRSVIPGRADEADSASLDRAVFGAKKRPVAAPANDREDYPDPMEMDVDEAGHLVDRTERRKSDERRKPAGERRKSSDRRTPDFPPLRDNAAAYRVADDGKRGPILLVGALVIVAVFGVVVWSAYRDGVKTDDPDAAAPQLATAGAFKTPPREVKDTPVAGEQPADLEQLDGGPSPVTETRVEPAPSPVAAPKAETAAIAPAASKVMATPPAPLKPPVTAPAPVQQAAVKPVEVATATVAPAPKPANPPVELPKPTASKAAMPVPVAAAPAPAPQAAAFSKSGTYVVQIAAPSTEASAIAEWDKRAKALPELFSGAERFIVQADVNGKTVYRLRAGPFGSKADADAFCSAFKAKGGNCFPATK
ncbi:MAG: SPOR domain-containing protein [Hyphomonadaceae bacterium]